MGRGEAIDNVCIPTQTSSRCIHTKAAMYPVQGIAYNNNFQMDQIHRKLSLQNLPSYIGRNLYDVRFLLEVCQDLRIYFRFYHLPVKSINIFALPIYQLYVWQKHFLWAVILKIYKEPVFLKNISYLFIFLSI